MNQLKPCPFCGAKAAEPCRKTYGITEISGITYAYIIECTECTCDIEEDTLAEAITVWNTRHGRTK